MTMNISTATARIGRQLGESHTAVDAALVSVAALFASATQARADITEVDAALGYGALLRMHKSAGALLAIRADLMRVHGALKDDLRVVSGAEEIDCPKVFTDAEAGEPSKIAA